MCFSYFSNAHTLCHVLPSVSPSLCSFAFITGDNTIIASPRDQIPGHSAMLVQLLYAPDMKCLEEKSRSELASVC